jgi:hypothetical protein
MPQLSKQNFTARTRSIYHAAITIKPITTKPITIKLSIEDECQSTNDLGMMLQAAIERSTSTPWRSVAPTVAVERVEPYRALVVRGEDLRAVEGWRREVNCNCVPKEKKRGEITLTLEPLIPLDV